jgi:hypothetical protein
MDWPKATGKFLWFAIKPLRYAEPLGGWVGMIIQILILIGIVASVTVGITTETARWLLTIITPSLFAILFLIAGIRLQRRLSAINDLAKIKPGDAIENRIINIALLFENRELCMVDNVTFIRCAFRGPCLVALKGHNDFSHSSMWGSQDYSEHLILADETRKYNGAGIFMHCSFKYCKFENIAWLLNQQQYDKFLKLPRPRG